MRTYYLISDLHIGGDEALGVCDFEDELISFLEELAGRRDEDVELIILGDAFGLWEFTTTDGHDKVEVLIGQFPRLFDAFRRAGSKIRITLLPGNHDYELACYPAFVDLLAEYNIALEQAYAITREVGSRRIWMEHGNQHDPTNRMPDYGNPHAQPIGYFITSNMVGGAGQRSERGRHNWLKDIQSVYPTEAVPDWVWSNYFYKEMTPFLRWIALPFLLLFGLTLFVLAGGALEAAGLSDSNLFLNNRVFDSLGIVGNAVQLILTVNAAVLLELIILAVPGAFMLRDMKRAARRFGIQLDPGELTGQKADAYVDAARAVFAANPDVAVFAYGHTHAPSVQVEGERAIVNTGTWIKQFDRARTRFGLLPRVYVPKYRLSTFRIHADGGDVVVEYRAIDKEPAAELTLTQRLVASSRRAPPEAPLPARTVLRGG